MASPSPGTTTPATTYSSSSHAVPTTQPSTLNGTEGESSKTGADPTAFAVNLQGYLFNTGFMHQHWADVRIVFFESSLQLHRIILARSPYLAHLLDSSLPGTTIHLSFTDDNITQEAIYLVLQHLYAPTPQFVTPTNARAVMAAAYLFGIPDLAEAAYAVCADAISVDNVGDYVRWLGESIPAANGFAFGSVGPGAIGQQSVTGQSSWANAGNPYGDLSSRLRQNVVDFLLRSLPAQLQADAPAGGPQTDPRLLAAYVPLPFDLFKTCVESPDLPIPFMQDRFAFAKRAIAQRKKLAQAAGGAQMEESVVLALKPDGDGMAVTITRKPRRSRALWKVEG